MQALTNKRILLGITGSVAAYKAADLVRRLRDAGAEVRVVMTRSATAFVTPLTFQAVSGHPVHHELIDEAAEAGMGHIELSRWADVILVAPAGADFIARLTGGRASDLLGAICLASKVPLALAPAMNQQMWADAATQDNIRTLQQRGVLLFGPDNGVQACGDVGPGRMLLPEDLIRALASLFAVGCLAGQHVVITAGPTREAIDPVRYLSNHSSGKMGYALAAAAVEAGARVTLISGPVALAAPDRTEVIAVTSAAEMLEACLQAVTSADIFIAAAAVADYRPVAPMTQKLKKDDQHLSLQLEPTTDIVRTIKSQRPALFCVGFAAETEKLAHYARAKLLQKKLDMVAANLVGPAAEDTAGTFGSDENALQVFWPGGEVALAQASKNRLARELITLIAQRRELQEDSRTTDKVVTLRQPGARD
ncbi:MAG: bifunctional phosphopantothenoylcysteine decarboxylase/phosphopantothenate--cysteine ligase CoaBC [Gammaproteobacteria bacterium]